MNLPATSVNVDTGAALAPELAALAQLAFAASTPADTAVAAGADAAAFAAFSPTRADALDLDLSDPGQCRFGDYTLLGKLGQGGMGVVYRAHQHSLDREVAVKLLAAGPWASPGFIERFRQEAQSAARMQHPNIVTIHEIGEQDGLPFFSMRMVRGQSLAERVQRGGALPARDAAAMLRSVAEAVDYAHRLGVLHLDIKPGNVLIDESGEPMVADFGLARRLEETLDGVVEEVSGTPSYMAPEQVTAGGRIGVGTDVYALGATLYEALTARPPFRGSSARETLEQVVRTVAPSPRMLARAIPLDLQAICMRCLSKDPAERYPSARALAEDLGEFLKGREVKARPLNRPQRLVRLVRREPRLSALVTLFVASLLVGLLATTAQWNRADANATDARESLWSERAQAAENALDAGNGFQGLHALVSNLKEMEAAGNIAAAMLERQRVGTLLANAPQLVDRIPLEVGQVITSVALSPDASRVAIATHLQNGQRGVRQYEIATGRELWSTLTDGLTRNLAMARGSPHGLLRYSADGSRIIASLTQQPVFAAPGTADQIALDASDGRVLQPAELPPGHSDMVFSDDGRRAIVRARTDPSLRFPDRFRFHQVDGWTPVGPWHDDVSSMWLFAPDGDWLLRTRDFVRFEAVEFGTLAPRWTLELPEGQMIRAWRFAPDGSVLALGALDGSVFLVDVANGQASSLPSAPVDTVRWLEFDPASQTLAALSETGALIAWNLATRRPRSAPIQAREIIELGRVRLVDDMLALADGNAIATWQLPPFGPFDNQAVPAPARVLGRRPFSAHAFDIDPQRRLLVSGGAEGALGLWRLPQPVTLDARAAPLPPVAQGFDGSRVVAVDGPRVTLIEIASGAALIPPVAHPQSVDFAELSFDGRWLATIAGRTLRVFDAASGVARGEPMVLPATPVRVDLARAAPLLVLTVGLNSEGKFLEHLYSVDLERVALRDHQSPLPQYLSTFRVDPRGRFLLVGSSQEPRIDIIDLGDGPKCGTLGPEGANMISDVAIDAAGGVAWIHLSPGRRRAAVLRWNLADCSATTVEEAAHLGLDTALLARGNGVVVHRHLANALALFGPEGPGGRVPTLAAARSMPQLALSADGRRVAVATRNVVQVYDMERGERLSARLTAPLGGNDGIVRLAFSPDGTRVLARSIYGRWLTWSLPASTMAIAELEQLALVLDPVTATRELDAGERDSFRARLRAAAGRAAVTTASGNVHPLELAPAADAAVDPRFVPLDLGPAVNVQLNGEWPRMAAQGGELVTLSRGPHRLGGIDWNIGGGVQLSGGGPAISLHPTHPESAWVAVPGVPARRVHVLMLIHIPMRPDSPPRRAGQVLVRHSDGRENALEIMSVRDVVTNWQPDLAAPSARVAWIGSQPTSLRTGSGAGFLYSYAYAVSLDLPPGSAPVTALRLTIGDGPMEAPLYYAVTLEVGVAEEGKP
jgi:WD40 repeat protein